MLRKTIIVVATAAALTGALTADAVALATAHTGWDGLGGGAHIARKHFGGPAVIPSSRLLQQAFSAHPMRSCLGRWALEQSRPRICDTSGKGQLETDWLAGHIGLELPNPSASHPIGFA